MSKKFSYGNMFVLPWNSTSLGERDPRPKASWPDSYVQPMIGLAFLRIHRKELEALKWSSRE
jgi:hypothetical protein